MAPSPEVLLDRQQAFGYTQEDLKFFLGPMARGARRTPWAPWAGTFLSRYCRIGRKLLYDYFTQCFAQVTNPPDRSHSRATRDVAGFVDRTAAESARL